MVFAGSGNDTLDITGIAGVCNGGEGDDRFTVRGGLLGKGGLMSQLQGGGGNDDDIIEVNSIELANVFQATYINNQGDAASTDRVIFDGIIDGGALSFQQLNERDLAIGINATNRHLVMQD